MKYATKLMVVPFVNKINDATEKYLNDLDNEMSDILERKDISTSEKLSLYNQALQKYLSTSHNDFKDNEIKLKQHIVKNDKKNKSNKPIKRIIKKAKRIKSEQIKKELNENLNDNLSNLFEEKLNITDDKSLIESKNNTPVKTRQNIVSNDAPKQTRATVKKFHNVLFGDPSWGLKGSGLLNKKFIWKTKKFF